MRKILFVLTLLFCSSSLLAQDVKDANYRMIGRVESDGTVKNSNYSTIGHIKQDGTVQDGNYSTIGHIKSDGTIQDGNYHTIGYAKDVKPTHAAMLFFFNLLK